MIHIHIHIYTTVGFDTWSSYAEYAKVCARCPASSFIIPVPVGLVCRNDGIVNLSPLAVAPAPPCHDACLFFYANPAFKIRNALNLNKLKQLQLLKRLQLIQK